MSEPTNPQEGELKSEIAEITPGISSLGDVMTTAQLRASTRQAQAQRAIITEYVREHLVKGSDYGPIGNFKKDVLFKPGQEKIFSLMNLTSRLDKDTDTLEMIGGGTGVVAYICRVYRNGQEIAQGRGAAKVGDNSRDINSTIKIAEKRARMDACLSLGFSEFFTQDLEDPEYRTQTVPAQTLSKPATDKQREYVKTLLKDAMAVYEEPTLRQVMEFLKANGVADHKNMTSAEASAFIEAANADKLNYPGYPATSAAAGGGY